MTQSESMSTSNSAAETLFNTALLLDQAGRAAYLASACGVDHSLRGRVEALLHAYDRSGDFLPDHPRSLLAQVTFDLTHREQPGDLVASRY